MNTTSRDEITVAAVGQLARGSRPTCGHVSVLVVGGGQAGLSTSYFLKQHGIDHIVLERHQVGHAWSVDRWDSFCLVTPNWQCQLPGFPYSGSDPDGFMLKDEIVDYVKSFARFIDPPIREDTTVVAVRRDDTKGFFIESTAGSWTADNVVLAISGYHVPAVPRFGERLPHRLHQLHSRDYRNPASLPAGGTLIVGTGQSGCQIAEDLHRAGREVFLAVGNAPRSPRLYRGKDAIRWLDEMGYYETTVETHPLGTDVRKKPNHYFTGRDGGHEIDLRQFAAEGMQLFGMVDDVRGEVVTFRPDLASNLDAADKVYLRIRTMIDDHIARNKLDAPPAEPYEPPWLVAAERTRLDLREAGITTVIWSTGFRADFSFVDLPMFNGAGAPVHRRGVTAVPGLFILGLGWLWTWGSGRFSGIAQDAAYVVEAIVKTHP